MNPPDKLAFEVNEFCRLYSIGRTTFYEQIKAGHLKVRKVGTKTLVLAEDAQSWLAGLPTEVEFPQSRSVPR